VDWRDDVWQRFRRDLPGLVLIWVALTVIAIAIEVLGGDSRTTNPLATGLGVLVLGVALTPLIWMRHEIPLIRGRDRAVPRAFAVIGLGCLWSVVALVIGVWLLAAFGVD
jgi:hypothetical protein